MAGFRKWERLPVEMCSRAPGTWFRPSSIFSLTSLFCLNLLPPQSFQKVLNSNACLLPTYIWPGAVSGLKGTDPEMHVYPPPRVAMPTLLTVTVEEQGGGQKGRRRKGKGGESRRGAAPQAHLQTQAHMSHSPFLLLQETKSVCGLFLGQPSAHPRPQGPRKSSEEGFSLPHHETPGSLPSHELSASNLRLGSDFSKCDLTCTKNTGFVAVSLAPIILGSFPKRLRRLS